MTGYAEPGVDYLIDSVNPISWISTVKQIRRLQPDILLMHWWHVYWTACFTTIARLLKSELEIVVICHNPLEHESQWWKQHLADLMLSQADRFIVHSRADEKNLTSRHPNTPIQVHPIPVFDQFPDPSVVLPRRAKLELLFFGFVRPYKGLDVLLEAVREFDPSDVFLSVVGEFWDRSKVPDLSENVELVPKYVSDLEAASYFKRCDYVVLPYRSATGSAVIPVAYHFGKPVIVTRVGGLPELVSVPGTGLVVEPNSAAAIRETILKIMRSDFSCDPSAIDSMRESLSWNGLVRTILN